MSTFNQLSRSVNTKTRKADGSRIPPPCHIVTIPQGPPTMRQHCRQPRRGIIHVPPVLSSVSMLLQPPHPHPPPTLPSTAPFNLLERVAPRTMDTLPQCPSPRKIFLKKDLFGHNRLLPNFRQTKCYTLRVTQPPLRQKSLEMMD